MPRTGSERARLQKFEEPRFVVELQFDLEPCEFERCNAAFQMARAVDTIFFGSDQNFGAVHPRLMGNPLQFRRIVRVVIGKAPAKRDLQTERFESLPEVFGIAEPAKCSHAASDQIGQHFTAAIVVPGTSNQPRSKGRSSRIDFPQALADCLKAKIVFRHA